MLRVSMNLRGAANLLLCAALAGGCSSSDSGDEEGTKLPNLISFSPMYSAFDGTHEFAVTPSVPSAKEGTGNADPIVASSLKWKVDEAFVKRDEFPELAASVKLTTKKAGKTTVSVTAKTMSGQTVRGESILTIDSGNMTEWEAGETRYNNGMMIPWMRPAMAQDGWAPVAFRSRSSCPRCPPAVTATTATA